MQPRTKAWTAAVAGSTAGVVGLALLTLPAGAEDDPELPDIAADELVASVLAGQPPAFAGTVAVDNDLGLPQLPGMDVLDVESARVWYDGDGRGRASIEQRSSERVFVYDGDVLWSYDSGENAATRTELPAHDERPQHADEAELADPASAATAIIDKLSETSVITVDGTARVADRDAYELVLTPKPDERTLLREVKVAIDADTRLPLRLQVMPNGSPDPALSIGFSDISFGEQDDALFSFEPPAGASVTDEEATDFEDAERGQSLRDSLQFVGDGWDTVITAELPADAFAAGQPGGPDPRALLEQLAERVDGDFGSGYLITTSVVNGVLTDDGRIAVGAVPEQVLFEALETK